MYKTRSPFGSSWPSTLASFPIQNNHPVLAQSHSHLLPRVYQSQRGFKNCLPMSGIFTASNPPVPSAHPRHQHTHTHTHTQANVRQLVALIRLVWTHSLHTTPQHHELEAVDTGSTVSIAPLTISIQLAPLMQSTQPAPLMQPIQPASLTQPIQPAPLQHSIQPEKCISRPCALSISNSQASKALSSTYIYIYAPVRIYIPVRIHTYTYIYQCALQHVHLRRQRCTPAHTPCIHRAHKGTGTPVRTPCIHQAHTSTGTRVHA